MRINMAVQKLQQLNSSHGGIRILHPISAVFAATASAVSSSKTALGSSLLHSAFDFGW
jgi:hypothetical protein